MTIDLDLAQKEKQIIDLLRDSTIERKYDNNHVLVLFKMYNFEKVIF
jgi:hypothetical protein